MTKRLEIREFEEETGMRCVFVKDAPLKVDLFWTHAIIQRISGKRNNRLNTVRVRLLQGWSPNGDKEFEINANERVNIPVSRKPESRPAHFNLRPHQRKRFQLYRPPSYVSA